MNGSKNIFAAAIELSKTPLGIIGLFIGLSFLVILTVFKSDLSEDNKMLVFFCVSPFIVFLSILFTWLLVKHTGKLLARNERYVSKFSELLQEAVNKRNETKADAKVCILWVDDHHENNICEKQAFEEQGIEIDLASSTDEALRKLKDKEYNAIISDIKRKEGKREGYVLLDKIREDKNEIPFFIYAGSDEPEQTAIARDKGAQITNQARELYQLVMEEAAK